MKIKFVVIFLTVVLAACSKKPESTVSEFMKSLKEGNHNTAERCLEGRLFEDIDPAEQEFFKVFFKSYSYNNIKTVSITKDSAVVSVNLTAVDLKKAVNNFMSKLLNMAAENPDFQKNEDELNNMLIMEISSPDAPTKSAEITLDVVKIGKNWKIVANQDLSSKLTLQSFEYDMDGGYDTSNMEVFTENAKLISVNEENASAVFEKENKETMTLFMDETSILEGKKGKTFAITYEIYTFDDENFYWLLEIK